MNNTLRVWLCSSVFVLALAAQSYGLVRILPLHMVTNEGFHEFMLYSMAFAFIPLVIAVGVVAVVLLVVFSIAYALAGLFWSLTKPG